MASYDDTATVSGSVVSFSNGADDVPTKSLVVTIPPTLSGKSEVTEKQTGRNLLVNNGTDISGSGLSFVVNSDKSVTISGVATANAFFTFFENVLFKASSYMIRGSGNSNVQIIVRRGTASGSNIRTASTSDIAWNLAEDTSCACVIRVASGTDLTTPITVYPQIEIGSSLSDYEMAISTTYTAQLGRTIHGGQVDIVNGEGKDNFASVLISETSWTYDSANARFISANLTGMKNVAIRTLHVMAYGYETIDDARPIGNVPDQAIYNANYERKVIIHDSNYTNVSDFLTAKGNISIIYPLATPTDFTFTGQTIETKLGANNFWSEQGDTELTYYKSWYGFTSVMVNKTGKNFLDDNFSNLEQGSINGSTGANENANNRVRNASAIPFPYDEIGSSYTWTIPNGYKVAIRPYDANGNFVQLPSWALGFITQLPQNLIGQGITQMRFVLAKTDNSAITPSEMANIGFQIELGSQASSYEPYEAVSKTVKFHRIVYEGEVDAVRGTGKVSIGESGTEYDPPETFTFEPISISTDEGENTLFANEGDSAITYRKAVD